MASGLSTATQVHEVGGGHDRGDLEDFTLTLDGNQVSPDDRNIWGVTFLDERPSTRRWLPRKDLARPGKPADRTLTSLTDDAECPSVSPDGARVAFKVDVDEGSASVWEIADLDLATMERSASAGRPAGSTTRWSGSTTTASSTGSPAPTSPG